MLPHTLGLENETTLRDHLVIRFQPLENCIVAIRCPAKFYLTQLETSFTALDWEEHVVPLADRLHGCPRHTLRITEPDRSTTFMQNPILQVILCGSNSLDDYASRLADMAPVKFKYIKLLVADP